VHRLATEVNKLWTRLGGYGGDFATVWVFRTQANAADLIFSTVDTVGIPLVLLRYFGFIHRPIVYVSIGLPERIKRLRNSLMRTLYRRAFSRVEAIVAYGFGEAEELRQWLRPLNADSIVKFIPFGVDVTYFRPFPCGSPDVDILSIGADPHRDFSLLIELARRHSEISVRIVTSAEHARKLGALSDNVQLLTDVPFASIRDHIAAARIVTLPLKENSYSGATTTLLQAMAMAKPVVISAVGAIKQGYHLEDGVNCKLITPGNGHDLEEAISALLADPKWAQAMGTAARQTVVEHHSWEQYVKALVRVFTEMVEAQPGGLVEESCAGMTGTAEIS